MCRRSCIQLSKPKLAKASLLPWPALRAAGKLNQAVAVLEKAIAPDPLDALSYVHRGGRWPKPLDERKASPPPI